jgi:hypothetical protein
LVRCGIHRTVFRFRKIRLQTLGASLQPVLLTVGRTLLSASSPCKVTRRMRLPDAGDASLFFASIEFIAHEFLETQRWGSRFVPSPSLPP